MVRSFLMQLRPRLLALAAALLALCALARVCVAGSEVQSAFFGMLFPQLIGIEATPGEAVIDELYAEAMAL